MNSTKISTFYGHQIEFLIKFHCLTLSLEKQKPENIKFICVIVQEL